MKLSRLDSISQSIFRITGFRAYRFLLLKSCLTNYVSSFRSRHDFPQGTTAPKRENASRMIRTKKRKETPGRDTTLQAFLFPLLDTQAGYLLWWPSIFQM